MANVVRLNVYQMDNIVFDRDAPKSMGFPTQGCVLYDASLAVAARTLSSGYQVYGMVQLPSSGAVDSSGHDFYVAETIAQLITLFA